MNPQSTEPNTPPQMPQTVMQPPTSPPPSAPPLAKQPGGKPKGLIIGLIVGAAVIALAVAAYFIYTTMFSPSAQAMQAANAFMQAITTGKTDEAAALSTTTSQENKDFIASSATKVKGTSKLSESQFQSDTGYYLYTLDGSSNKYARVIVKNSNGKWGVDSFVYSQNALKLMPSSSSDTSQPSTAATTPTPAANKCLVSSDYNGVYSDINGGSRPSDALYSPESTVEYTQNLHFLADSLNYDNAQLAADTITAFADFYKSNSAKSFTIHVQGNVATTAAADLSFANQRAQKVIDTLKAQGVPAAYVVLDAPSNVGAYGSGLENDEAAKSTARNIVITIVSDANCDK